MSLNKAYFTTALIFAIICASHGSKRSLSSSTANIVSFPYMVLLEVKFMEVYTRMCSGTLIRPDWVISAAQCIRPGAEHYVKAGVTESWNNGERRRVKETHELRPYVPGSIGDIIVIQLESSLPINKKIQTIELPPPSKGNIPLGMATVIGWGGIYNFNRELRYVNLPIKPQDECVLTYGEQLEEDMFCTGYAQGTEKAPCEKDAGGPLVLDNVLYGIISWGNTCERPNNISVYVKVPYYVPEITQIIDNAE